MNPGPGDFWVILAFCSPLAKVVFCLRRLGRTAATCIRSTPICPPRLYACLCGIAKDEAPEDVRQWVYYHLGIGFERIILYDNNSRIPLNEILADLCMAGLAEVIPMPLNKAPQLSAYFHCLQAWRGRCRWLAFLDIDEFLVPLGALEEGGSVPDAMRDCLSRYEAFAALAVSWLVFGSSGHLSRPAGGAVRHYTESLGLNSLVKSIVQPDRVVRPVSPHHFACNADSFCVNEDGFPVSSHRSYTTARHWRVNHYYYKSQQDYEEKIRRGLATDVPGAQRSLQIFYEHCSLPAAVDTVILPFLAEGERLSTLPPQKAAQLVWSDALRPFEETLDAVKVLSRNGKVEKALALWRRLARYHDLGVSPAELAVRHGVRPWQLTGHPEMVHMRHLWTGAETFEQQRRIYGMLAVFYASCGCHAQARAVHDFTGC